MNFQNNAERWAATIAVVLAEQDHGGLGQMKNQIRTLIPMRGLQIVPAITPGLVLLLMMRTSLFSPAALSAVSAMIIIGGLFWKRQIVAWMFPALGVFFLFTTWQLSEWGLVLNDSGGEVVLIMIVLILYAISLILARQHGLIAGLILAAVMYLWADVVLETAYGMSGIDYDILSIIPVLFILIIFPMWMLYARTLRAQVVGFLLPGAALLGGEIYKSLVVLGNPYGVRWSMLSFYFIPVTISAVIYFTIHGWGRRGASQA